MKDRLLQYFLIIISLSITLQAEFRTIWQKSLPETGLSGVCVKNGLIFFTVNDLGDLKLGNKPFIMSTNLKGKCYDLDGSFKWEVKLSGSTSTKALDCWLDGTVVTPQADDKYVWFLNILGELVCCTHDGQVKWRKEFLSNGGITPSKILRYKNAIIMSLPTGETAGKYKLHRLQALDHETGELLWKSDKILNHACRYDFIKIDGKPVILASITELAHYKIKQGSHAYMISPETGKCFKEVKTDQFMQHFRCTQYKNNFISITKKGELKLTDFANGSIKTLPSSKCDVYYQWSDGKYRVTDKSALKSEVKYGKISLPTKSSMNLYGDKLFYFNGGTNAIVCFDMKTQKSTWVEVPYQILKNNKVWNYKDIIYTAGVLDSKGETIMQSKKGHGYVGYGWGHVNIAEPLLIGQKLYWLGGVGVIYIIDLSKEFSPASIETVSIDPIGEAWTFGKMAYSGGYLFIRSQKDLFKIKI